MRPRWHEKEALPRCECLTDRKFHCVRPARVALTNGKDVKQACTAHATLLERQGWDTLPPLTGSLP
jgi:hypothetical protein